MYSSWETAPPTNVRWARFNPNDEWLSTVELFWRPESTLIIDDDSIVMVWPDVNDPTCTVSSRYYRKDAR